MNMLRRTDIGVNYGHIVQMNCYNRLLFSQVGWLF